MEISPDSSGARKPAAGSPQGSAGGRWQRQPGGIDTRTIRPGGAGGIFRALPGHGNSPAL